MSINWSSGLAFSRVLMRELFRVLMGIIIII